MHGDLEIFIFNDIYIRISIVAPYPFEFCILIHYNIQFSIFFVHCRPYFTYWITTVQVFVFSHVGLWLVITAATVVNVCQYS